MLADQFTVVACYCQNRIIALVSHVMLCSDNFALVFVEFPSPGMVEINLTFNVKL
jgi:hypothetical protein